MKNPDLSPIDLPRADAIPSRTLQGAPAVMMVAATFTADGLEPPLAFMLDAAGLAMDVRFAPYHQVFQQLLAPQSELASHAGGVHVVLVRLEDFLRELAPGQVPRDVLARTADELIDAARQFMRRSATPCVWVVFEPSPAVAPELREALAQASGRVAAALDRLGGTTRLDARRIDALCGAERHDAVADRLAHIPYTDAYFAALAIALARAAHRLRVPAHKVLVLDCDNTLWRGVVGEDGPQGIAFGPEFLSVQRFAVEAQAAGALVCLASKNAEADVLEVLATRAEMVLKAEHIVAHRINWEAKASNLRSLARELNLGLDAFVFVDDNPVECGQMREALPEVVTLGLPPGADDVTTLLANLWVFDKTSVTDEDARRTAMYRENAARDSLEADAGDIGEFLASLELVIDIAPPRDDDWPRVSQLTHRTNQFNFTTRRRSEADLRALAAAAGAVVLAVRVRDRFGDYGLVGVVVAEPRDGALEVDTLLLSCRVLGRGVEHAVVARMGALALAGAQASVRLPFRRTPKNEPARAFADSVAARYRSGAADADADAFAYDIPAAVAAAISHRPGDDAPEVIEARRADAARPAPRSTAPVADRSSRYLRLATELVSGPALLEAMQRARARARDLDTPALQAATPTERRLLQLWETLLGIAPLGVADDYFALGGSSLQAARLFAAIARELGVELPLTTILEAPTVRRLAARIDAGEVAAAGGLVPLRLGGRRKLFLVHDGDGETLLYRNLAALVSTDLSVYGVQPARRERIPLAHSSVEAMAASYVGLVRAAQPHGPYLLGGMCAGGLIAFEMAVQLERAGQSVDKVLVMDAAVPRTARRPLDLVAHRRSRLAEALAEARRGRSGLAAGWAMATAVGRKVGGVARHRIDSSVQQWSNAARFALLRRVLAGGGRWPRFVAGLDFRSIYNAAEAGYRPAPARAPVLLVRARAGTGGDTAYVHLYGDPLLGWRGLAARLDVVDVDGGHASMLQEPHAASVASAIAQHLQDAGDAPSAPQPIEAAHG